MDVYVCSCLINPHSATKVNHYPFCTLPDKKITFSESALQNFAPFRAKVFSVVLIDFSPQDCCAVAAIEENGYFLFFPKQIFPACLIRNDFIQVFDLYALLLHRIAVADGYRIVL